MAAPAITFAALWSRTGELLHAHAGRAAAWLAVLVALGTAADVAGYDEYRSNPLNLGASVAWLVGHYALTRAAVRGSLAPGQRPGSFARYFLLTLLLWIALIMGLVALVLPAIFLAVRWTPVVPAMIAGNLTIGEAFGAGWEATGDSFWPILLVLAVVWVPATTLATIVAGLETAGPTPASSLVINLLMCGATIAGIYVSVAVFDFSGGRRGIEEVFA